jgi:predicted flap endonuclease-1-like 5' DNA nuclease
MAKLLEVEGIGAANAQRLEKIGVTSIEQLLRDGASPAGRIRHRRA